MYDYFAFMVHHAVHVHFKHSQGKGNGVLTDSNGSIVCSHYSLRNKKDYRQRFKGLYSAGIDNLCLAIFNHQTDFQYSLQCHSLPPYNSFIDLCLLCIYNINCMLCPSRKNFFGMFFFSSSD